MKNIYKVLIHTFLIPFLLGENIDLSQEWEIDENYQYSDDLENIISDNISDLPNMKGFIVIQSGKIISENYYKWAENRGYNYQAYG